MILQLFRKTKELTFERSYPAPVDRVWEAWTDPELLRRWWGPDKTFIDECEVDPTVGGTIHIVMVAGDEMGKYAGTRWPMQGTFTRVDRPDRLVYDARSWTEGEEDTTTIVHQNVVELVPDGDRTTVNLTITISEIGSKAKMAAFGMKWGYKAQLDKLEALLGG